MNINSLKFKSLIAKKSFTQISLSDELNLPKSSVSVWVNRGVIPNKHLTNLNTILDIDLEEYFAENNMQTSSESKVPYYGDLDISIDNTDFWSGNILSEPTAEYVIPDLTADLILPVIGNNMSPKIDGGDKIAVKRILDLSFFVYGAEYVIITEEYCLIRQIRKHKDGNYIILHSYNDQYDDIDLPKNKILHLFSIVEILKKTQL